MNKFKGTGVALITPFNDDGSIDYISLEKLLFNTINNNINYTTLDTLTSTKELIIAMPFPYCGDVHTDMQRILDKCEALNIPVHIDGALLHFISI